MTPSPPAHSAPTSLSWPYRLLPLLIAFSFMTWFNRLSMPVAYDTKIGREYGISEEAIGLVYSAFLLAYCLFMIPGGWFIDRFGAKAAILIMGLGSGLFGALTSCAGLAVVQAVGLMVGVLLVIRFAMGVFTAPYYPAAARMVSIWVPENRRAFANGLNQAAANVGMACAFPVFGALVDFWDWPTAFAASGVVTMALALLWWVVVPNEPFTANSSTPERGQELGPEGLTLQYAALQDQPATTSLGLFRNRNVMLLAISYATMGYLDYLFFFWMNHYFGAVLKIDKSQSRIYSAILLLSMAVGIASGGWLADWLRKRTGPWLGRAAVPMAGMTLSAVFLGFGLISQEIGLIVFWLALALVAVGAAESPTWTAAVEFGGKYGGTSAAILNTGGNVGGFIAPMLTPIISHAVRDAFGVTELAGWQWGIAVAGVLCLGGACLWWWIRPKEKQEGW